MGLLSGLYRGCGCTGLIALGLLAGGGQALYTAVVNRSAVEMTCAEYLQQKPEGKWLKLKDCELSHFEELSSTFMGKTTGSEVFIPVRPASAPDGGQIHILLASKRPEDLEFAKSAEAAAADEKSAKTFLLQNLSKAKERRDIEGLVRHGLDSSDKKRRRLSKASEDLAADFIIIDDGKRPNMLEGVGFLIGGVIFLLLRLLVFSRRPDDSTPNTPPPLPSQQ